MKLRDSILVDTEYADSKAGTVHYLNNILKQILLAKNYAVFFYWCNKMDRRKHLVHLKGSTQKL